MIRAEYFSGDDVIRVDLGIDWAAIGSTFYVTDAQADELIEQLISARNARTFGVTK